MPDEVATLFDTTAKTESAAAETVEAAKPADDTKTADTTATPTVQDTADKDAAEIGRILLDSGYKKEQLNDLIEAPGAIKAMQFMIRNNPQEFLNMLERTDPDAARNFHEKLADIYVDRYSDKTPPATNGAGKQPDGEIMREVQALRDEVKQARTREEQREQAAALAATQNRYNGRVDDLFNQDGVKKLGLTKSEQKAIRSDLSAELAKDPSMVRRISNGNFVDVPKTFQGIIESWATDRKAAADTAKAQRDRATSSAFPEFSSGPNPLMIDVPANVADSWDNAEEALAAALTRTAR